MHSQLCLAQLFFCVFLCRQCRLCKTQPPIISKNDKRCLLGLGKIYFQMNSAEEILSLNEVAASKLCTNRTTFIVVLPIGFGYCLEVIILDIIYVKLQRMSLKSNQQRHHLQDFQKFCWSMLEIFLANINVLPANFSEDLILVQCSSTNESVYSVCDTTRVSVQTC